MGFSQEIKDFLAGYSATSDVGMKAQGLAIDRQKAADDKAYREANLAIERDRFALQKSSQGLRDKLAMAASARAEAASKRADAAAEAKALADLGTDPGAYDYGYNAGTSAAGAGEASADESVINSYLTEFGTGLGFSRGGMVQTAADGAMVGALPIEDDMAKRRFRVAQEGTAPVTPASNSPAAAIPTAPTPLPREARPETLAKTAPVPLPREERVKADRNAQILATAGEATELAMRSLKEDAAAGEAPAEALPTGAASGSEFNPLNNRGAATPEEIKAIDAKIGGSFDGYMKGAARLSEAFSYYMDRGEIERAANVAKRILLFDKQASQTRGFMAQQALEQGDTASAARLISDAYNENIPDGQQLKTVLNPDGSVSYTVMKGDEVVQQGTANTEQLWAMAAKVKDGSEFLNRMAKLAQTYSPMGSNGEFGKAQTEFVKLNADFLSFQDRYLKASDAEKRAMSADYEKLEKAHFDAYRDVMEIGAKYVKGKSEAEVYKTINDSLKAAVAAFGSTGAAPAPAAPSGDWNKLLQQYNYFDQAVNQFIPPDSDPTDPNSAPLDKETMARLKPFIEARDRLRAEIDKLAPQVMPGKSDVEIADAIANSIDNSASVAGSAPLNVSGNSWLQLGGTLPVTGEDAIKERLLQQRIASGEKVTFKPLGEADVSKVVDVVVNRGRDANAVIGKLIRDGFDPTPIRDALKELGINVAIDIGGISNMLAPPAPVAVQPDTGTMLSSQFRRPPMDTGARLAALPVGN
jgi:hypothetical protein